MSLILYYSKEITQHIHNFLIHNNIKLVIFDQYNARTNVTYIATYKLYPMNNDETLYLSLNNDPSSIKLRFSILSNITFFKHEFIYSYLLKLHHTYIYNPYMYRSMKNTLEYHGYYNTRVKHKKDITTCSICLNDIKSIKKTLKCNHSFHTHCINNWSYKFMASFPCPICRTIIPSLYISKFKPACLIYPMQLQFISTSLFPTDSDTSSDSSSNSDSDV